MQHLEIISLNVWQILISLCNLLILFVILKRFLYKPVNKVLAARQQAVDSQYAEAEEAKKKAEEDRAEWESKMRSLDEEAENIIQTAASTASKRSDELIAQAKDRADSIIRTAKTEVELERRKAEDEMKNEIINVSSLLTEKMLSREINSNDHKALIDSFLENMGDANG